MTETNTLNFSADVARLLDIVANALYSNRDVFLRELVANAADACDRRRYEAISTPTLLAHDPLHITVVPDPKARTLSITDNGIGMTRVDLVENLGTIARSGTRAAVEQVKASGKPGDLNLIGQFGVGFYASFMVSNTVDVITRRAGGDETLVWSSDGRGGYTITTATPEQAALLKDDAGTVIVCHIKDDSSEFLLDMKCEQIIKTYADHITYPIYIADVDGARKNDGQPINEASALWARPKASITKDQYKEFFGGVSGSFGLDEPLVTAHWKAEGKIEFTALLFVPSLRPADLFDPSRSHAVRLYVKRVFITDKCEGLIFPWLRFLRGVVDSEDLPLNISREMLQTNPVVTRIRNAVATRIIGDLAKLAADDMTAFKTFWGQFGSVLKEGLYDAADHREDLLKVCRFYSSTSSDEMITLDDYVARMKPGQDFIYYFSGENREALNKSPQLEGFRARGIEALFMTDTVDDFWIPMVQTHHDKMFHSITKGAVDLSSFPTLQPEPKTDDSTTQNNDQVKHLLQLMEQVLFEAVGMVRPSNRLTTSPVCLVAGDNDVDLRMDRVLKIQHAHDSKPRRILEVNPNHPIVKNLAARCANMNAPDDAVTDTAWLLYDQARIIQGEPVENPSAFAERMSKLLMRV